MKLRIVFTGPDGKTDEQEVSPKITGHPLLLTFYEGGQVSVWEAPKRAVS